MEDRIDALVRRLAVLPADRSLENLEAEVTAAIEGQPKALSTLRFGPLRLASVGIALAMGIAAGGLSAAAAMSDSDPHGALLNWARLAPSTLLEGHR